LTEDVKGVILIGMATHLNISLPPALRRWIEEQTDRGGYETAGEYVRQLIRDERRRQSRAHVEEKLREALASGEPKGVTTATWEESEARVEERLKAARKRRADGTNR
jgi:antitoxin ParD1/3/4